MFGGPLEAPLPDCKQTEVLLAFKSSLPNGEQALPDWVAGGHPCTEEWTGLVCNAAGAVTEIDFKAAGVYVEGPIPPQGWPLPSTLLRLDLSNSLLGGTLPAGLELPAGLTFLNVSNTSLTGSIPNWALPDSFELLDLSYNSLTGPIPPWWPRGLLYLVLNNNSLNGTIPSELGQAPALNKLALWSNHLNGTLPSFPGRDFLEVYVDPDSFCGTIPAAPNYYNATSNNATSAPLVALPACNQSELLLGFAASFTNGEALLGSSWASGTYPCRDGWMGVACDDRGRVTSINLASAGLQGTVPYGGWQLPETVSQLLLYDNPGLAGPLPTSLRDLPDGLAALQLWGCSLNGSLPAIALPAGLTDLDLGANSLIGTIPPAWADYLPEPMQWLRLHENRLTGTLPTWATLPGLHVSVTPGNPSLCGPVPATPQYLEHTNLDTTLDALPACPVVPPPSTGSATSNQTLTGGSSTSAAVIGGATGGAACAGETNVVAAVLALWCWRRRRRLQRAGDGGAKCSIDTESGKRSGSRLDRSGPQVNDSASGSGLESGGSGARPHPIHDDPLLSTLLSTMGPDTLGAAPAENGSDGSGGDSSPIQRTYAQRFEVGALQIDFHELNLERQIGAGSFGRVYVGTYKHTSVAVKLLLNTGLGLEDVEAAAEQALSLSNPVLANLQQEASTLAALRHPNIVSLLGVCPVPPCLVTEYCSQGSLADVLRGARRSRAKAARLTFHRRLHLALDCATGMHFLHAHTPPVMHRDLKSPNLLVDKHWRAKVCDFNLAKIMGNQAVATSVTHDNPRWLAPEIIDGQGAVLASDVYAFAIVMHELLTFELPWGSANSFQIIKQIAAGGRPPIPDRDNLPGDGPAFAGLGAYVALMQRCWAHRPEERPTFSDIIGELRRLLSMASRPSTRPTQPDAPAEGCGAASSGPGDTDAPPPDEHGG